MAKRLKTEKMDALKLEVMRVMRLFPQTQMMIADQVGVRRCNTKTVREAIQALRRDGKMIISSVDGDKGKGGYWLYEPCADPGDRDKVEKFFKRWTRTLKDQFYTLRIMRQAFTSGPPDLFTMSSTPGDKKLWDWLEGGTGT